MILLLITEMAVLVVGGWTIRNDAEYMWQGMRADSTEVIGTSTACSSYIPPPLTRTQHTSVATPTSSLICGNEIPFPGHHSCIAFNTTSLQWTDHSQLTKQRTGSSAVVLASGAYVLGGLNQNGGNSITTSDFLPAGSTTWQEGPSLPGGGTLYGSCVVALDSVSFLLIGGSPEGTQVREYNELTKTWSDWPNLEENWVHHSCLRQNDTIIVVGGYINNHLPYHITTTLIHLDGSQETAGNLSTPRVGAAMAVINGKITILGGANDDEKALTTAEVFDVPTKTWSISSEISLQIPRFGFALLPLPMTAEELCSST